MNDVYTDIHLTTTSRVNAAAEGRKEREKDVRRKFFNAARKSNNRQRNNGEKGPLPLPATTQAADWEVDVAAAAAAERATEGPAAEVEALSSETKEAAAESGTMDKNDVEAAMAVAADAASAALARASSAA